MELKKLLSVFTAAATALGAMLFAMGSQRPWLAVTLWLAAAVSLVVTDFFGAVRLPRSVAAIVMWGMLLIFVPDFFFQSNWDSRLRSVASVLIVLQMTLLFQDKDPRVYGWLIVMSLLQAVVAARYSQGVGFGILLICYAIVGIFAMSLLVLYSQWSQHRAPTDAHIKTMPPTPARPNPIALIRDGVAQDRGAAVTRWPLAAMAPSFNSVPAGSERSGIVTELFARLALIVLGAMFLAGVIFYAAPRLKMSAWRGESRKTTSTVGFNEQINLGGLGQTIENLEEVMQLKLRDNSTGEVYPMRDDAVYLRGTYVTWYSQNSWRRLPPPNSPEAEARSRWEDSHPRQSRVEEESDKEEFRLGPPVVEQIAMEPYLNRDDLFFIWPLIGPIQRNDSYQSASGRLMRTPTFEGAPRGDSFRFEVLTSGLVDGHQADLIPASGSVREEAYLQMPDATSPLPRLTALATRWLREGGLGTSRHYEAARYFEQQLSNSGQFHYSLEGVDRDTSMDAIEDFVSNHPQGHCEYFATALALMLRSQGIPARVVLGYRCDEWHADQKYYQVRQLHAHAWVEAFLAEDQIPATLRRSGKPSWINGGWLRLDPTPASDIGTQAAERTTWGAIEGRWHGLQRFWDKYIVDMDRNTQRDSVYEPISRATSGLVRKLFDLHAWKELALRLWTSLADSFRSGIMGWLFGVVVLFVVVTVPVATLWWFVRLLVRLWRRFSAGRGRRSAGAQSTVEFYRRFEQIAARVGLQRGAGQTHREFARVAGSRIAATSGRHELYAWAMQIVEEFYRVRFGRQELDAAKAMELRRGLDELAAGSQIPPEK